MKLCKLHSAKVTYRQGVIFVPHKQSTEDVHYIYLPTICQFDKLNPAMYPKEMQFVQQLYDYNAISLMSMPPLQLVTKT